MLSLARPMTDVTRITAPVCTSYTMVLDKELAVLWVKSVLWASSRRLNMDVRRASRPSCVILAMATSPRKLARPRRPNTAIRAIGTIHGFSAPFWKPLSSKGLSMAGTKGSVAAPTMVAMITNIQAERRPLKK